MDTARVASTFGTYRVQQVPTPRERRAALWYGAVVLVLLAGWGVVRFRRDGADGVLDLAAHAVLLLGVSALVQVAVVRWGPQTRLDAEGVRVMTGLTGGRRSVPWDEVVGVGATDRFTGHPVLVLRDGGQLVLPGVPAAVAADLRGAHPAGRAAAAPVERAEDGWEGPFRRG